MHPRAAAIVVCAALTGAVSGRAAPAAPAPALDVAPHRIRAILLDQPRGLGCLSMYAVLLRFDVLDRGDADFLDRPSVLAIVWCPTEELQRGHVYALDVWRTRPFAALAAS